MLSRLPGKVSLLPGKVSRLPGKVSLLPGKVSRCGVDLVKRKQKVFPLSGKVVFIWDKNNLGHRDLACQQPRSRYTAKNAQPVQG